MAAGLKDLNGAGEKVAWLDSYNSKVKELNSEMELMSKTTGVAFNKIETLGVGFFDLSDSQ
jgi:hypothetical protein